MTVILGLTLVFAGLVGAKAFLNQAPDCENQSRVISPTTISPGEVLRFNVTQSGLTCGWGETEPWGTWTISKVAALDLDVSKSDLKELTFNLKANPFIFGKHDKVSAEVFANGKKITVLEYSSKDATSNRSFTLTSKESEGNQGNLHLVFVISEPISPLELKIPDSSDERKLGLGFVSIELEGSK